jgi:hypothetical protein
VDEIQAKVNELQAMLVAPASGLTSEPKAFDWWAIAALVMQLLQMILDKFKPTPQPNP